MTRRRFLLPLIGVLSAVALFSASAADAHAGDGTSVAAAINKAGRQRMLSQRAAKAWLMVGQGIAPERGTIILTSSFRSSKRSWRS